MATKSSIMIGGSAIAAMMIGALTAAQSIDAFSKELPGVQVDRSAKGDRLAAPRTIAVKKAPSETARELIKSPERGGKLRIMDGCDPMFSPVMVPAMAHIAGRCVG